ncbi:hypothetical protein H8356DRAFT_1434229 [Neocallimastix lanati (nom. inval.)]|nr:hypothetical protein H8356DRAFT_1434229 [Neocallimastix sp. JGI-2020a]
MYANHGLTTMIDPVIDTHLEYLGDYAKIEGDIIDAVFILESVAILKKNDIFGIKCKRKIKRGNTKNGSNIIIQPNSASTVNISNFEVSNAVKLYLTFADINMNYGVSAILKKIKVKNKHVCQFYKGNNNIKELSKLEYQYEFSSRLKYCTFWTALMNVHYWGSGIHIIAEDFSFALFHKELLYLLSNCTNAHSSDIFSCNSNHHITEKPLVRKTWKMVIGQDRAMSLMYPNLRTNNQD